ncbi:MAG: hypothetical protein R3E09_12340 [Novosphingobium sp.]|nr:hypothetical protein [Novosphingobium sp.]
MRGWRRTRALQLLLPVLAAIGTASCAHADAARTDDGITCLAGIYDGGQPEVAAGLALGSDRRFSYGLSYGALDERAEGRWEADRGKVYLTSNPVKAPELVLLGERASPDSLYRIELDLPAGLSRQYFDARIELADGQVVEQQLDEDGLAVEFADADRPVSVALLLPLFGVESPPHGVTREGPSLVRFRFDANDLGKVAFERTPLAQDEGELVMERHGRSLHFRPVKGGCVERQAD